MSKPFSQACENNKHAILQVLTTAFAKSNNVLEIGSGTGQHAVHFAKHLSTLHWHTADQSQYHSGINQWLEEASLTNLSKPLALNVNDMPWQLPTVIDSIFSANTLHIMSWPSVQNLFQGIGEYLSNVNDICFYGPFNYGGEYSSESNARFDQWLLEQSEYSAIRDFEAVNELANKQGFVLVSDHGMPANNRLLHWRKS
jgi:cyclopropane fatty-acyl-phospholipid synthase-like methyltransferase